MTTTDASMPSGRGREVTARGVSRPADEGHSQASGTAPRAASDAVAGSGGAGSTQADVPSAAEEQATGRRPSFTITDAAVACVVSRKTITRKLPELATHGAAKDADGIWRIPVEALLAVGLHPGRSVVPDRRAADTLDLRQGSASEPAGPRNPGPEMITIPRDRWDDVRIRLARAEAEAAERGLALADARLALRALGAAPSNVPAPSLSEPSWQGAWHQSAPDAPSPAMPAGASSVTVAPGFAAAGQSTEHLAVDLGNGPTTGAMEHSGAVPTFDPNPNGAPDVPVETSGGPGPSVVSMTQPDLFIARSRAVRSGQVVPVVLMATAAGAGSGDKKRRWWKSR